MDARQTRTLTDIAKRGPPSGDFFSSGCRTAGRRRAGSRNSTQVTSSGVRSRSSRFGCRSRRELAVSHPEASRRLRPAWIWLAFSVVQIADQKIRHHRPRKARLGRGAS